MMSRARHYWIATFFWIGVILALASFAFVMGHGTELVGRFEHRGLPLSWVFGVAAVLAFLAAEICHAVFSRTSETEMPAAAPVTELESVKSQS
jgi:hypothetical protein